MENTNTPTSVSPWILFDDKMPEIGQEILVIWPSGKYRPEYRIWTEEYAKQDWSCMRWYPIPKQEPLPKDYKRKTS